MTNLPPEELVEPLYAVLRRGRLPRAARGDLAMALFYTERGAIWPAMTHCQAAMRLAPDEELIASLLARLVLALHRVVNPPPPEDPRPWWHGEPLDGARLIVVNDDVAGLGDRFMWARFLPAVAERARAAGGTVAAMVPPSLVRLWQHNFPDVEVIPVGQQMAPGTDRWFLLEGPDLAAEAGPFCPYLKADPADVDTWRQRLQLRSDELNVGVVWQPGPPPFAHADLAPMADLAKQGNVFAAFAPLAFLRNRGVELADLAPLAGISGVRLFGLQVGRGASDPSPDGMNIERIGPALRDFGDTAAVATLLDLVVSIDSSTANLVGAMGLPGFVLLPMAQDVRWRVLGWFPSVHLFHQVAPGDWSAPVAQVAAELAKLVAQRRAA